MLIDDQPPFTLIRELRDVSCPSETFCAAVDEDGRVLSSANPAGGSAAWQAATVLPAHRLNAVSCPITSLCVAVSDDGRAVVSTDPAAGVSAWQVDEVNTEPTLTGISCPSASLCAAVTEEGEVVTSTDPASGGATWEVAELGAVFFTGISCPSASLCAAIGNGGQVFTSTDPTAGAAAWQLTSLGLETFEGSIDCPSASLCVVVESRGKAHVSTDPTAGAETWATALLDPEEEELSSVSCPSVSLCVVASESEGAVYTSTEPAGGDAAWTARAAQLPGDRDLNAISCPSTYFCAGIGRSSVFTTADPTGDEAWGKATINSHHMLNAVSCPTEALCVVGDEIGNVLTSTTPTGDATAWSTANIAPEGNIYIGDIQDIACPSVSFCAAVNYSRIRTSTDPTAGAAAWDTAFPLPAKGLRAIHCRSAGFCVAVGRDGAVFASTDPTGGGSAWRYVKVTPGHLNGVSCPSATLCVAVGNEGAIFTSTNPMGSEPVWERSAVSPAAPTFAVFCPSTALCLAGGEGGHLYTSTDPTGGGSAWNHTALGPGLHLSDISCPSETFCVSVSEWKIFTSSDPANTAAPWHEGQLGPFRSEYLEARSVSCPSTSLCLMVDSVGQAFIGTPGSTRTLAVSKAGDGEGSITSDPQGIECGPECSAEFDDGTPVTLTASPGAETEDTAWGGCDAVNTANQCEVTMSDDRAVTATFDRAPANTDPVPPDPVTPPPPLYAPPPAGTGEAPPTCRSGSRPRNVRGRIQCWPINRFGRFLPAQFFGLTSTANYFGSPADWDAIQSSGATLVHVNFLWPELHAHGWEASFDQYVGLAAQRGVAILPYLYARRTAGALKQFYLSSEWSEWLGFVRAVVKRYGYGGSFWAAHPNLPRMPIRVWEVWNEPDLRENNPGETVRPRKYAKFLIATSNAIRNAQKAVRKPGEPKNTQVLFGGLNQEVGMNTWKFLKRASSVRGASRAYDGLSIHPYELDNVSEGAKLAAVIKNVSDARKALDRFGGGCPDPRGTSTAIPT